ncbi:MAG: tetratricopeptide repeat protein [Victivallaceae bacterium]|nr:tetratricopeptide repeat protein [Victivallaceae bacterium]
MRLAILMMAAVVALGLAGGCGERTASGYLLRAESKAGAGNWKEALHLAERALVIEPDNVAALIFRAIACERNGMTDKSLDSARRAVELSPDNFAAQYTLGRLYADNPNRGQEAYRALLNAYRLNPDDRDTLVLLANVAGSLRSNQVIRYLQALRIRPDTAADPALNNELAIYYIGAGNQRAARDAFLTACRSRSPRILLNAAIFFDRYADSRSNARAFYMQAKRAAEGKPELKAMCGAIDSRLREIGR